MASALARAEALIGREIISSCFEPLVFPPPQNPISGIFGPSQSARSTLFSIFDLLRAHKSIGELNWWVDHVVAYRKVHSDKETCGLLTHFVIKLGKISGCFLCDFLLSYFMELSPNLFYLFLTKLRDSWKRFLILVVWSWRGKIQFLKYPKLKWLFKVLSLFHLRNAVLVIAKHGRVSGTVLFQCLLTLSF